MKKTHLFTRTIWNRCPDKLYYLKQWHNIINKINNVPRWDINCIWTCYCKLQSAYRVSIIYYRGYYTVICYLYATLLRFNICKEHLKARYISQNCIFQTSFIRAIDYYWQYLFITNFRCPFGPNNITNLFGTIFLNIYQRYQRHNNIEFPR